ncbi:polysaccharide deacetylase [Paenibacillus taihuensis]|uniref:Polysaccharide deacetylase n=1 Tax=Paenibacillus taihuensis TaxID=1156355 RepID=A0A3D9S252_9BACL|nr:polysaccharide deacetylase family protein [Paenibacillus taihuensis]REE86524.1 polysaccharide deacetylase [Paenibacillus taihuensis]
MIRRTKLYFIIAIGLFMVASLTITVDQLLAFKKAVAVAASSPTSEVQIPVLCYHSISDAKKGEYIVGTSEFKAQMKSLHDHGYRSISLEQFDELMKGKLQNDGRMVLITFDDGYRDNYTNAYPILSEYGFTATEFLVTSWVGGSSYMNWSEAGELYRAGWDIMSHTRTHPYLPLHGTKEQREEIAGSKQDLEKHLPVPANVIAYPYGLRSAETVNIVAESGYTYAFTFDDGMTTSSQNPYLLKRLFIKGEMDAQAFERKMGY